MKKIFFFLFLIFSLWSLNFDFASAAGEGWELEVGVPGLKADTPVKDPGQYFEAVYKFAVALGAILAVVMIIYGGFIWMTSPAIDSIAKGKEMITGAISGLILLLASYLILYTINPELTGLDSPPLGDTNIDVNNGGGGNTGGGGNEGGGGTFTGQASNANGQKLMQTFYKNPSLYNQGSTKRCDEYCKGLEYDTFKGRSKFHQFAYGYNFTYQPGYPNQILYHQWVADLQAGRLPNPRINGEASGQHWIIIYAINGNNINFYDPNGGQDRTLPFNASGTNNGYFFGAPTAYDGTRDGWGGYISVP